MKSLSAIFLLIGMFFSLWVVAQNPLPRYMTQEEIDMVKNGEYSRPLSSVSVAPPGPVRVPAEWEEMQGVIIVWESFSSILAQITDALKDEVEVFIVCPNENSVKNYLENAGIDFSENVSFYELPSNSLWVRDYGPNSAYLEETGELVWIDWIYNRPRYQDDQVPQNLGAELGIPVYETGAAPEDLVNTGGNFMSDGMGIGFSSDLVLDENGLNNNFGTSNHDEEAVDNIMNQYMGISTYIKMEALPYDLIHHIDMHMKIIDEETIMVGEYPENVADGPQIEANIQYILDQFTTSYGRPFNIVRIPMPPGPSNQFPDFGDDYRTYANAIIANQTILVPTYEEKYDTTALRIWEETMPGYNVVGINCNSIIPLSGALHCITKEVASESPILINMKKDNTFCSDSPIQIKASIKSSIDLSSVELYYSTDGQNFNIISMEANGSDYSVTLPEMAIGENLSYYIKASNIEGKEINRPFPGADGPRSSQIVDCNVVSTVQLDVSNIHVFPNPASAITCIAPGLKSNKNVIIDLLDSNGQLVKSIHEGPILSDSKKFFFDASEYPSGQYFIRLSCDGQRVSRSLAIVR